jgi:micrococcal nuclease
MASATSAPRALPRITCATRLATSLRRHNMRLALLLALFAPVARADPCKAIHDRGPMPAHLTPGKIFSGPVVYIGDGDSLCVALGPSQGAWVEVRMADFYAPELSALGGREAMAALERIAMGRRVECVAQHRSYDRVVAVCTLQGISLGDRMRAASVTEGGNGRP